MGRPYLSCSIRLFGGRSKFPALHYFTPKPHFKTRLYSLSDFKSREASGLRRVHRRFSPVRRAEFNREPSQVREQPIPRILFA